MRCGPLVWRALRKVTGIAIIGAGNVGRALATAGVRAGHSVVMTAFNPDHGKRAAAGSAAAAPNAEAAGTAEVAILAMLFDAVGVIVDELGAALDRKIVVDDINRVNPMIPARPSLQRRAPRRSGPRPASAGGPLAPARVLKGMAFADGNWSGPLAAPDEAATSPDLRQTSAVLVLASRGKGKS